ncbi:IpaD/SipD/SspD family type III secretion system needle tip protein [Sodalis ligni]|uniref:IpaD/SipD/SspD family type III secretion system needle tip protein n=1 Tax=Sodalis ligni TaxID=2697027 RepID=UPI00193F179B|nr:IpaD/SipD/SspD family type III secretion system needle tip protein [Sodalis ligni]QWA10501.1 IpaD/SipD/SspD family type III secretion system needle tip protein [Sodalis ligni]
MDKTSSQRTNAVEAHSLDETSTAEISTNNHSALVNEVESLTSQALADLENCRETLSRNDKNIKDNTAKLESQFQASKQRLDNAIDGGLRGETPDQEQNVSSLASAQTDPGWQVDFKSAMDKLNGVKALEQGAVGSDIFAKSLDDGASAVFAGLDEERFKSYRELWQDAVDGIGIVKAGYLDVYETVVERYTAFYSAFSDFMSGLTALITFKTDDKGTQTMEFKPEALKKIEALINSYSGDKAVLFPASGTVSETEAKKWASELGLPAGCVKSSGSGFVVTIDLSPLITIRDNLKEMSGSMTTFQYQSWKSGFDAQSSKFQTTLQTLTTKYGNANGMFDTANKILSSTITSGAEALKQILASM